MLGKTDTENGVMPKKNFRTISQSLKYELDALVEKLKNSVNLSYDVKFSQ